MRLALKLAAMLPATVTVVAYAEFENVIEVDRDRKVATLEYELGRDRTFPGQTRGRL